MLSSSPELLDLCAAVLSHPLFWASVASPTLSSMAKILIFVASHGRLSDPGLANPTMGALQFIDTFQLFFWLPYFSLDFYVSIICKLNINL